MNDKGEKEMKIGWCSNISNIALAQRLGFDYLEGIASAVAAMDDGEFARTRGLVTESPVKTEAFCVMFGGGIPLTGEDASLSAADEYIARLYERLSLLGGRVAVFGSGGARRVPDGFDRERAFEQLVELGGLMGRRAAENGLTVALEPLNSAECNIITSSREGARLVEAVAHPNFRLLLDMYHMGRENEDLTLAGELAPLVAHTHIAHPVTRHNPVPGDEGGYERFISALKAGGYDARVSFEGSCGDPEAMLPQTLAYLRSLAQ